LRTHVNIRGITYQLHDPGGFAGFDLKTAGEVRIGPQNLGDENLGETYGVIV
jgi:hypothetical protein